MYWQVHVRVSLCDLFYALMHRKLQDKTKLENFARPSPGGIKRSSHGRTDTRLYIYIYIYTGCIKKIEQI